MRLLFLSLILLLTTGCMESPAPSSSKEAIAQDQIQSNKTEAEKAKEEYMKIQQQRQYN